MGRIGREGIIGPDVFIDEGVVLGDRVQVHRGAILYQGVTADDGVFVGPAAILTNYRRPRALNLSGDPLGPGDWEISPIHLSSGASIGAAAVIVGPCDIGPSAMIGAGAVVTHDVPGYAIVAGNPCPADRLGMRLRRTTRRFHRAPGAGGAREIRPRSGTRLPGLRAAIRPRSRRGDPPRGTPADGRHWRTRRVVTFAPADR